MRTFDAFLAPTESIRIQYLRWLFDRDAIYTSLLGVDNELFRPMDKRLAKSEVSKLLDSPQIQSRPIVGYLSRFQPEKGASIYTKIAELLPEAIFLVVAPTLHIYGYGDLPPNLIYAGHQPRENLPLFLNAFDVLCFPSMVGEETFGLAVAEAMACGVPPVVAGLDGLPEVVGEAGIVIPATPFANEIGSFAGSVCPVAMSGAIRTLLQDDEQRLRLGQQARDRASGFTWDRTARDILTLFHSLNERKKLARSHRRHFSVFFTPYLNTRRRSVEYKAVLCNVTDVKERPLMMDGYDQTVEEALALDLLRTHGLHEIEAVLAHFCDDEKAREILAKVKGFRQATS